MANRKDKIKKKQPEQSPKAHLNPYRQRFGTDYGLDFAFMCAGMPFHGNTDRETSLGGSETACLQLARALNAIGNQVMVYCNCPQEGNYDGVEFIHLGDNGQNWLDFATNIPHDVSVVQRIPNAIGNRYASRQTWLWMHDLLLKRANGALLSSQWQMDRLVVPSDYMKRQYQEVGGYGDQCFFVTTNGIDYGIIDKVLSQPPKRNPKRLAYAARPERGLEILLGQVMPALLERDPSYEIHVYGYDNKVDFLVPLYESIENLGAALGDSCVVHSPLPKPDLYREYMRAGAYVYPTNFYEISCITAMECMALGLPFISSKIGALPETLHPKAGVLISPSDIGMSDDEAFTAGANVYESVNYARDPRYVSRFVDEILAVTQNADVSQAMAREGQQFAKRYSWDNVAVQWVTEAMSLFGKWTKNKGRLARHFWWLGDHVAAQRLWDEGLDEIETETAMDLPHRLKAKAYLMDKEQRDEHYCKIGNVNPEIAYNAWREQRYQYLIGWLRERIDAGELSPDATVLDWGCAHGGFSVGTCKEFLGMRVVGIDVSDKCIAAAKMFREIQGIPAERCEFLVTNEDSFDDVVLRGNYDLLVCFDVLEHMPDPMGYLNKIMPLLSDNGWVLITVPHGNGDVTSERTMGVMGCHLHSFDRHDIRELFSTQKDWKWTFMGGARSKLDNSPQGWYFSSFRKSDRPLGQINWERKCAIQTPRQTVSGHVIAYNSEALIGRAIKSIAPYCDEVDVLDCGSIDATKAIAESYGCRVHEANTNPLREGFEATRNENLAYARGDWILWVDTDEELCNGVNLPKYLRHNYLTGYSIRQHHLSVEPPNAFPFDMPIRVFRRTWPDDTPSGIFWHGMIHEHVETRINEGVGPSLILSDVDIAHDGYFTEAIRRERFNRNFGMVLADRARYPDRILGTFIEMRDCIHICRYLAQDPNLLRNHYIQLYLQGLRDDGNRAILNPREAQMLAWKRATDIYKDHILPRAGEPHNMVREALEYNSEALRALNKGFEAKIALQLSTEFPQGRLREENIVHARFESKDDMLAFINARAESQYEPLDGPFGG